MMSPTHQIIHRKVTGKKKRIARCMGVICSRVVSASQPNQHPEYPISPIQESSPVDAAVCSEGAMFSTMKCISQSVHQTESLDSNVLVMLLRGDAHRINYFWYHNWYICNDD
jgi:hypothetical protein